MLTGGLLLPGYMLDFVGGTYPPLLTMIHHSNHSGLYDTECHAHGVSQQVNSQAKYSIVLLALHLHKHTKNDPLASHE
jgi:hypothetical protein